MRTSFPREMEHRSQETSQNGVARGNGLPSAEVNYQTRSTADSPDTVDSPPDSQCLETNTSKGLYYLTEDNRTLLDHFKLSEEVGQSLLGEKKKGPISLLGTGSSVASASNHSEVSDFESDSGVETSNVTTVSPEVGVLSPLTLSPNKKKGQKNQADVLPHDDLAVAGGRAEGEPSQEFPGGSLSEVRIDSFINCLDDKVSRYRLFR